MQLDLLFQIAGVGILTTVVASVLNSSGRSELANLATVAGLAIVLLMVVSLLSQLFTNVRTIFSLDEGAGWRRRENWRALRSARHWWR